MLKDQIKRYGIYIVGAVLGLAMIVVSIAFPEWGIKEQLALFGQIVTALTTILAAVYANPAKNIVIKPEDMVLSQDIPLTQADTFDEETAGEIIMGPGDDSALSPEDTALGR